MLTAGQVRALAQTAHTFESVIGTTYRVMFRNLTEAPFIQCEDGSEITVDELVQLNEILPLELV